MEEPINIGKTDPPINTDSLSAFSGEYQNEVRKDREYSTTCYETHANGSSYEQIAAVHFGQIARTWNLEIRNTQLLDSRAVRAVQFNRSPEMFKG